MFIFDVLRKDKVYQVIVSDLRRFGVKYRHKKNASVKTDKPERNGNQPQKIFKVHLTCLPLDLVNLSSGAMVHIPIFVIQATAYLLNYIDLEGIFRKAGSKIRQREILSRLDNGGCLADKDHGIDIANCLKTFFRDQPEPLIPFYFHDLFVRCVVLKKNRIEALLMACLLLPPIHLNTLAFLMEFLKKVASYEQLNRMSIVNLATVVGPNIMPIKEATMGAIQSRLETHNLVVQLLIENAEKIGVLPDHITETISAECEIGSTENELERSDNNLTKSKKKKHRSGSFTRKPHLSASNLNLRMLSGLKKMVGKTSPHDGEPVCEGSNSVFLYTPSLRIGKRRKVEAVNDELNIKKDPIKDGTPTHMSRVDKFISSRKVPTEIKPINKTEKTKKIRLSFDRFVSRTRQKTSEAEHIIENDKPLTRRRSWSITGRPILSSSSSSSELKKKRRSDCSTNRSLSRETKIPKLNSEKEYDEIFMDANINLSDISGEPASRDKCKSTRIIATRSSTSDIPNKISKDNNSILYSTNTSDYVSHNESSSINDSLTTDDLEKNTNKNEEYVKVPKSEYLDIKKRVSAIETQISQEFGTFAKESINNLRRRNSVDTVQSEYEKTLEQSNIGNTMNADQLAKRLGKELKIRRSSEHKIIRSPSARKIGVLRRRSQEKPISKRIKRTSSWHVSDRTDSLRRSTLNNFYTNTKDNQNLMKSNDLGVAALETETFCSEETNKRLNYLQDQLLTLIDHTNKHTKGSFSDDDFSSNDNHTLNGNKLNLSTKVRRISSFHGNEFIDNSQYFNRMVKDLKKSSNIVNNEVTPAKTNLPSDKKDKVMSWKDAEKYFKSEGQIPTPVPVTGRASVAKLRTQNAGMVLAKAKLFDDTKRTPIQCEVANDRRISHYQGRETRRQSMRSKEIKNLTTVDITDSPRRVALRRKKSESPKNPSAKVRITKSPNSIKMELTLVQNHDSSPHHHNRKCTNTTKRTLNYQKENHATLNLHTPMRKDSLIIHESNVDNSAIYKTPLIKKPLAVVRTPKSGKPLTRRPAIDVKRTPLKAIGPLATPKRQSPRSILKTSHLTARRFS
ncbi:rho GTPase-activating protein 11A-like isoform X3 [Leptopilina boulardi]|uniref:rho GTPase-activating protein 11A-like isoform X3 n=1 Tax=Leptopilina boulardi TaxID=63433 RepID=UPI0021F5C1FA|nr:rho GTPase-activating protein 11A-like isoform X3 [Leptopilina boulardi]